MVLFLCVLWCELPHGVLGGWLFGRGSSLHESVPGLPLDLLVDHRLLIDLQLQHDLQLLRGLPLLLDLLFSRHLGCIFFPELFREIFCGLGAFCPRLFIVA
jgi:hypothetical protein